MERHTWSTELYDNVYGTTTQREVTFTKKKKTCCLKYCHLPG